MTNLPCCAQDIPDLYYRCVWRKVSKKVHKKWEGDGVLVVRGLTCILMNDEGKDIGRCKLDRAKDRIMRDGEELNLGGKEIEIMSTLSSDDYLSGRVFMGGSSGSKAKPAAQPARTPLADLGRSPALTSSSSSAAAAPASAGGPLQASYNPDTAGALVLFRPAPGMACSQRAVVVPPFLSQILRPHQREAVSFLYQCLTGKLDYYGSGAILADEMGLGKTLSTLVVLYVLLTQSEGPAPYTAAKAIVVTPATLVKRWEHEVREWFGRQHLDPITIHDVSKKQTTELIDKFVSAPHARLLLISYEQFRVYAKLIASAKIDLLVCDEGHRLKNAAIKTTKALAQLSTKRRLILTGTPVQNDLAEFFALIDFVNPGLLGEYNTFKRIYEDTIARAQERNASAEAVSIGRHRSQELAVRTSQFILRRTGGIMRRYLPAKSEVVVFFKLSDLQERLYSAFVRANSMRVSQNLGFSWALACITTLKKICNHPALVLAPNRSSAAELALAADDDAAEDADCALDDEVLACLGELPADLDVHARALSTKMAALLHLLADVTQRLGDRVVVVSNYRQTLELIGGFLREDGIRYAQLDGTTPTAKRPEIVNRFNKNLAGESVFLLSAKAGGVGLNLIGANRLVMFDPDWNPATDLQAMGRVWRDGQRKDVVIYRFLATGSIEEKIWQRQITKQGLSSFIVDDNHSGTGAFTAKELKNLFKLNNSTCCETHDLLRCQCRADGSEKFTTMTLVTAADAEAHAAASGRSLIDAGAEALDEQADTEQVQADGAARKPVALMTDDVAEGDEAVIYWTHTAEPQTILDVHLPDAMRESGGVSFLIHADWPVPASKSCAA